MKKISVVIGTNYGDEGKGLCTDWLASQNPAESVVVRFSGGANAGHTVETEDTRHVFSHFGSGTLLDVPTILTEDFIVNPVLFWQELEKLSQKIIFDPRVFADSHCKVTTPYDVYLNQLLEESRSDNRHGSTGVGINETENRHEVVPLFLFDLYNRNKLNKRLERIHDYFIKKTKEYNLKNVDLNMMKSAIKRFIDDTSDFISYVDMCDANHQIENYNHVIFEGSQGLMLDQNSEDFPNVTRANTGLTNIVQYLEKENAEIQIYYITRSYLTRHGNGPMPTEDCLLATKYKDYTNLYNPYQGNLRYGILDFDRMSRVIEKDLSQINHISYNTNIFMTWYQNEHKDIIDTLADFIEADKIVAYGKTRETVEKL